MVVIGYLSAMVATAAHAVTCHKSRDEKAQEAALQANLRTAGAIPYSMTSSPYDDYAPCTHGFPHRQCARGHCSMCRYERRRERRWARRAERDLDRMYGLTSRRCRSAEPIIVLSPNAGPTSDPYWNARGAAVPLVPSMPYQQEQGVQRTMSLGTHFEESPRTSSPPAYMSREKHDAYFN